MSSPSGASPELGAIDLRLDLGHADPVDEVGQVTGTRVARVDRSVQVAEPQLLEVELPISVLDDHPRSE